MTEQSHCWDHMQDHIRTRGIQVTCKMFVHSYHMAAFTVELDRILGCHGTSLTHISWAKGILQTIREYLKASWPRAFHCTGFQAKQHREDPKHSPPLPSWACILHRHSDQQLHCRQMAIAKASCECTELLPYMCQTYANTNMHSYLWSDSSFSLNTETGTVHFRQDQSVPQRL